MLFRVKMNVHYQDYLGQCRLWLSFLKEIGPVFINAKEEAILRITLEKLGHPQPPTQLETDNTTATGYSNGTIKQKHQKAMDMHFYWIKDRVKKGQFNVYWGPGCQHLADYFTKHHSPAHH
jgi:hypothetical protein